MFSNTMIVIYEECDNLCVFSNANMYFFFHYRTEYFFYSLLFRDASTSLVISHLGSLGVYQKAVYFYCCVVNVSFVKFTDFNFMMYEFYE